MEIEADKALRLHQLDLESRQETLASSAPADTGMSSASSPLEELENDSHISLVPTFRETEVGAYFNTFERIASALHWPHGYWPLLVQCNISGKALSVVAALLVEDSLNYNLVKVTILRAYELAPEARRQKFSKQKTPKTLTRHTLS